MPNEFAGRLKARSFHFSLRVMRFRRTFHDTWEGAFVADQLMRASARAAAHYRAACRARSHRDFTNKLGMAVEEADESEFWLMFVGASGMKETADQKELLVEASELLAIFAKSAKTASDNDQKWALFNKSAISPQQSAIDGGPQRSPSMISSRASRPGRIRSSGSVASGSSTTFSWLRKSSRSGSM